jgi:ABC-type multidrug transport system ATPase subunit
MSIELVNVSRWYGNVVAVNDVTMSIGPGVTGLLGPNGAGKSTIMRPAASSPSAAGTAGVTRISTGPSAWSPSGTRCTRS